MTIVVAPFDFIYLFLKIYTKKRFSPEKSVILKQHYSLDVLTTECQHYS